MLALVLIFVIIIRRFARWLTTVDPNLRFHYMVQQIRKSTGLSEHRGTWHSYDVRAELCDTVVI